MNVDHEHDKRSTIGAGSSGGLRRVRKRDGVVMAFARSLGIRAIERANVTFVDIRLDGATREVSLRVGSEVERAQWEHAKGEGSW